MIRDVTDYGIYVSEDGPATGLFYRIMDATSAEATHGSEDVTRTRVFGNPNAYIRAGDDTDEYSIDGLYNPDDTNGQNILRAAHDNNTTVFLAFAHDDTPGAEKGYVQECRITEYSESADADGEYVECSFSAEGVGARVAIGVSGLDLTP
jgi:hypothetical protein